MLTEQRRAAGDGYGRPAHPVGDAGVGQRATQLRVLDGDEEVPLTELLVGQQVLDGVHRHHQQTPPLAVVEQRRPIEASDEPLDRVGDRSRVLQPVREVAPLVGRERALDPLLREPRDERVPERGRNHEAHPPLIATLEDGTAAGRSHEAAADRNLSVPGVVVRVRRLERGHRGGLL